MAGFHIGISGLEVAQRAIDLIGTNIANAATEGYHRQDLRTAPIQLGNAIGGSNGVEIVDVARAIDSLMERELVLQQPQLGQNDQELATLRLVENSLGDLEAQGLTLALDRFFASLRELSSQPGYEPFQRQAVSEADALAHEFRSLGGFLTDLEAQIIVEARTAIENVNAKTASIADMNNRIRSGMNRGANVNALADQRDQSVLELAGLVDIRVSNDIGGDGAVDIAAWGIPLIIGGHATDLKVELTTDQKLGVTIEGGTSYDTTVSGGKLGGLVALHNDLLPTVHNGLNTLAGEVIKQINEVHFEGVGTGGSFTDVTGLTISTEKLSDWSTWGTDVTAGTISVRVADTTLGTEKVYTVAVDGNSTSATLAAAFDGLTGLEGEVTGTALRVYSSDATRYRFDFVPAAITDMVTNPWNGTASPTVDGLYTGAANDTWTATVIANGTIGVTTGLTIEVRDGGSQLVKTLAVGAGYVAGTRLDIADGVSLSFDYGTVVNGEKFNIVTVSDPDTSGFMAAAGVNTLFSGTGADNIAVRSDILSDPTRLAVNVNAGDLLNAKRLAGVGETRFSALSNATFDENLRTIVGDLAQSISFREARQQALQSAEEQLIAERDRVGGVDINEEAAKLLVYQRMYQACAKFIGTQAEVLDHLMNVV